jgi:hypothetical protein
VYTRVTFHPASGICIVRVVLCASYPIKDEYEIVVVIDVVVIDGTSSLTFECTMCKCFVENMLPLRRGEGLDRSSKMAKIQ